MQIIEKILAELKEAQKSKNSFKLSALRLIKSAVDYKKLELKKSELEDSELIKVLQVLANQRKESIESFRKGNKEEAAKKEEQELAIVQSFLPESVPMEEIEKTVDDTIIELEAQTMKDMGKVMKACMERFKGKVVDGKSLSETVKLKLKPKEEKDDAKEE